MSLLKTIYFKHLTMVERVIIVVSLIMFTIDFIMAAFKGVGFSYMGYVPPLFATLFVYGIGMFYRISGRSENISLALMGTGGLVLISASLSTFNYLLLPIKDGTIDPLLAQVDGYFGIYWPDVMAWAADHPAITQVLGFAYRTTLPQLAILIVVAGLSGRKKILDQLSLSLAVSGVLVVSFWGIFPTLGAKCMYELPQEIWQRVAPVVDYAYAQDLLRLGQHGATVIDPTEIRGLIAFPSYHVTLAMIALCASWNFRYIFPIFLVLNLLIMPATMIHGGHHFVDPFGGVALFLLTHWIVRYVLAKSEVSECSALPDPA